MQNWRTHTESKPGILYGKPVIKNTRVPAALLLEKLSKGESMEDLLKPCPRLQMEDVFATLAFAVETTGGHCNSRIFCRCIY